MPTKTRKPKKRVFVVWLSNNTDIRDDEPLKVLAREKGEAEAIAKNHTRGRFSIGQCFTLREFQRWDAGWASLIRGWKAETS